MYLYRFIFRHTQQISLNPPPTTHRMHAYFLLIPKTYQAASGAGQPGMDELMEGTRSVLSGERAVAENKIFAHPLPFNVIPHIDKFQENGYTKEEMKVTWETRKICGLPDDFPVRFVFHLRFEISHYRRVLALTLVFHS